MAGSNATLYLASAQPLTADQSQWLAERLTDLDHQRLAAIKHGKARAIYLSARYWLYHWLATHGIAAERFTKAETGQPLLLDSPLHCSLSHTQDWIVLALAEHPIGVDIERASRLQSRHLRWFSLTEQQAVNDGLVSLPELWTLKEAVVKQQGSTLARELGRSSIDWSNWRGHTGIYSQPWQQQWQLSAYAPGIRQWHLVIEDSES